MSNVQLQYANLTDTNLSYSNLQYVNLSGAVGMASDDLTGVSWANGVICPDGTTDTNEGDTCIGHLAPA
jgi:hypothetical protein